MEEYRFRKFIKHNTTFEYSKFETMITVSTDKLGFVGIYENDNKIILSLNKTKDEIGYAQLDYFIALGRNENVIIFSQFQEFIDWLTKNMPEYLRPNDIKIALKD